MKKEAKYIRKYAFSFDKLNKFAAGEGLKYLSLEFQELDVDIRQLLSEYFKSFRDNKRQIAGVDSLKLIQLNLVKAKAALDEYYRFSNTTFAKFKKSIIQHDKRKLVEILGEDYMQYMDELIPNKGLSSGPKYKALMELVTNEDRPLMDKALNCIFMEPEKYGAKYREIVLYFNKVFKGEDKENYNYDWINTYGDIFKFAALPSYFDVRRFFPGAGQEVEFKEESLDITLTDREKEMLSQICETWDYYKETLNRLLVPLNRAYLVDRGYTEVEKKRNEELHNTFDRIRALKYMIGSFVSDGGSERDFYDKTGLTFRNAYAKIDNWAYILLKVFPSNVSNYISKTFMKKSPRTLVQNDTPYFSDEEESFFDSGRVEEYEQGNISGTMENGSEVLYRERPQSALPAGGLSSYHPASDFGKAVNYIKKFSNK